MLPAVPLRGAWMTRFLAVTVASLLMANGVVVAEYMTGRDLAAFVLDPVDDARQYVAERIGPAETDDTATSDGAIDPRARADRPRTSTTKPVRSNQGDAPTKTLGGAPVPGSADPGSADPGTADPGTADPGTADPGTADPGTADPGTGAPSPNPEPGAPAAPTTEEIVAELSAYVSAERSLAFHTPVAVAVVDDATFRSRLNRSRLDPALAAADRDEAFMRALGIIGAEVDLAAQVRRLATGGAPAFYDTEADELVVRTGPVSAFTRKIMVHELVTALHDQNFDVRRPQLDTADDESRVAFGALVEGVASRIEGRYLASRPEGERAEIEAEQQRLAGQIPRDLPQVVVVTFAFPFAAGLRLANALYDMGGNPRFDAAFANPPQTSEGVVHPGRYAAGEGAKAVAAPAADGPALREGTLGQLMLSVMLAGALDDGYAETAADGWGGDRYVVWESGGKTCVRANITMDNADEDAELLEGLTDWARDTPGATVEGAGPFTVTRCA